GGRMITLVAVRAIVHAEEKHFSGGRQATVDLPDRNAGNRVVATLSIVTGEGLYSTPRRNRGSMFDYDAVDVALIVGGGFERPTANTLYRYHLSALAPYANENDDVMSFVPLEAVLDALADALA